MQASVSWQIAPRRYLALSADPRGAAVDQAMVQMRKLDVAALEAAAAG